MAVRVARREIYTTVDQVFDRLEPTKVSERLGRLPRCVQDFIAMFRRKTTIGHARSKSISVSASAEVARESIYYYIDRPTIYKDKIVPEASLVLEHLPKILELCNPLWGIKVFEELEKDKELFSLIRRSEARLKQRYAQGSVH